MADEKLIIPASCILFATADWDEPYWTNKQHCARSLAELGTKVLYVESVGLRSAKAGSAKDWGRLWNRLCKGVASLTLGARERSPGIFVLSPLVIPAGHRHSFTRVLNRLLLRASIVRACRRRHMHQPLVWTYHPFMLDVLDGMDTEKILYHCVDDLSAVPGVDIDSFINEEERLARRCTAIFTTAPALTEKCMVYNRNTYFFPNVVDLSHFSKAIDSKGNIPKELEFIPEPRLVYHGVLSDFKLDFDLILEIVKREPAWHWVFIGEEREGQRSPAVAELRNLPNVHFLGHRDYRNLPNFLGFMQVGLLPSLLNDYTRSMFPMKYFEYLAAGLPVVSTPLDFTRDCSQGMEVAADVNEFMCAIRRQLARGRLSSTEVRGFVGENTWECRTRKMLDIVRSNG